MPDFNAAVARLHDAVDAHLATDATFESERGPAQPCRVLLDEPDIVAGLAEARGVVSDAVIRVRHGAIDRPRAGDRFIVGAQTFDVVAPAEREGEGGVWMIRVVRRG